MATLDTADPGLRTAVTGDLPGVSRTTWSSLLGWGLALAVLAWAWQGADIRPLDLIRDSGNMAQYASGFFPPNFREWRTYVSEMVVTLHIAIWGT